MVAADDEDGEVPLCQAAEKLVKQRYRLGGWDRLIVDVPGDDHRVGLFLLNDADDLDQGAGLVVQHGDFIDPLADVQVRQMDKLHRPPLK